MSVEMFMTGTLVRERNLWMLATDHPTFGTMRLVPCGVLVGEPWPFEVGQQLRIRVVRIEISFLDDEELDTKCLFNSVEVVE